MSGNTVRTKLVAVDEASSVFAKLNRSLKENITAGNLLGMTGKAALGGIAVAAGTAAAGGVMLGKAFSEASNISLSALQAANNLTAELKGLSLTQAEGYIGSLNKRLAQAAAILPGTTKDYVALSNVISNDIARAFQDADGALNVAGWEKATTDIVSLLKFVSGNASAGNVQLASQKLLAGNATLNEIRQYDFLGSNVAFMNGLEKAQKDLGKEWKAFTQEERVKTLTGLKDVLLSEQMLDRLSTEVSGVVQGFKTKIFDPSTGLLGIMRTLDKDGGSVYKSLAETVNLFIGEKGIISNMLGTLSATGFDPMVALKGQIDNFNDFITSQRGNIAKGKEMMKALIDAPGKFISEFINGLLNSFNQSRGKGGTDYGSIIGKAVANGLNFAAEQILTLVSGLDYGALAITLFNVGKLVISGIGSFLMNLDWQVYMAGGAALLAGALFTTLMASFIPAVGTAFIVVAGGLVAGIAGVLSAPVLLAIAGVGLVIVAAMKHFGVSFQDVMRFVFQAVTGFANPVIAAARLGFNLLKSAITSVIGGITTAFNAVRGLIDRIPGVNVGRGGDIPNAATGFIPDAFRREMNAMPAGSHPVIANSSELILTREQQAALLQPRGNTFQFGGITINAGNSTNPKELASQVIREIEARLQQSQMRLA